MSARKLTEGHMAKVVREARVPEVTDPKKLDKDQMRLYSFYKPSLQAGDYVIEATQTVSVGTESLQISNITAADNTVQPAPQEFQVVVPRFSLDPNLINSYYPPDGHQDEGRILPHVVLNDPHYPWEIAPGITDNLHSEIDMSPVVIEDDKGRLKTVNRGMVPWVALLVFDPEELHLPTLRDAQLLKLPGYNVDADLHKQNANGTFSMPIADYFGVLPASAQINYKAGFDNDTTGYDEILQMTDSLNVIFPKKDLIETIFSDPTKKDTAKNKFGIEQYKYLAHVRHINTEGCPDAGIDEEGLFSIVISSRTGALRDRVLRDTWIELPSNLSQPRTQVCHLVSIEHLDSTLDSWSNAPLQGESDRGGLVSLFSWIYTALPPDPVNFITTMRNLTENQQMLRADDKMLAQLDAANLKAATSQDVSVKSQVSNVLAERFRRGYTLARWRTQTGEETTAFNRGPLVPLIVPSPPAKNTIQDCSSTSQDYQILDPQTGLMDLSYSSAWQAGKLLAISDTAFSSALMRFRSVVRNCTANKTRMAVNDMTPKAAMFQSLGASMNSVQKKSAGQTGDAQRIRPASTRSVVTDLKDLPLFRDHLKDAIASNTGAGIDNQKKPIPYNGFNMDGPSNTDWPVIHTWLAEKLSLGGIPPQYLIPEPSFVPPESLRFFYIDDFWLDCLLDGALSVANHLDEDDDMVRRELKKKFNEYLSTDVPDAGFKPQVPCYGFIIRSKLIKAMPDLRITVAWKVPDKRFPVCRWTKWDDQTLMCLLDRQPQELDSLILSQPQHQQRYALGSHIDATAGAESITFMLRRLFTMGPGISPDGTQMPDSETKEWLNFSNRCLKIQQIATNVNAALQFVDQAHSLAYIDPTPNSCELGLELNDPSYFFTIHPPPGVDFTPKLRPPPGASANPQPPYRQLFVRDPPPKTFARSKRNAQGQPPDTSKPGSAAAAIPPATSGQNQQLAAKMPPTAQTPNSQLRIQPLPTLKPPIAAAAASRGGQSTPQSRFDLVIYPDYRDPPFRFPGPKEKYSATDYIATDNLYYFDLIFSIRKKKQFSNSNFLLLKIVLDIPIPTVPLDKKNEALLTPNYDGPGVRMMSNQHFVPFLFTDDKEPLMHIVLIPRSTNLDFALELKDAKTTELGFRLGEANLSPVQVTSMVDIDGERFNQKVGKVLITWTEWYSTAAHPEGEPVVNIYPLIKMNKRDDQEEA